MRPTFYRGCWHVVSRDLFLRYRPCSSRRKELYDPKAFFTHAASLHQACAHCAIFLTAASRRSLGRVSVPVWLIFLSEQLSVIGLVSRYLTNYLIERRLLLKRILSNPLVSRPHAVLANLSVRCSPLQGRSLRVTHPFATRILVLLRRSPFDLHALGTPPAFILSQDQTLRRYY